MSQKWTIGLLFFVLAVTAVLSYLSFCSDSQCAICTSPPLDSLHLINMYEGSLAELGVPEQSLGRQSTTVVHGDGQVEVIWLPDQRWTEVRLTDRCCMQLPDYGELRQHFCRSCTEKIVEAVKASSPSCSRLMLPDFVTRPVKITYCGFAVLADTGVEARPVYVLTPDSTVAIRQYTASTTGDDSALYIRISSDYSSQD